MKAFVWMKEQLVLRERLVPRFSFWHLCVVSSCEVSPHLISPYIHELGTSFLASWVFYSLLNCTFSNMIFITNM